jgi:hypothetical protein
VSPASRFLPASRNSFDQRYIEVLDDPFPATELGDAVLAAQPSNTMRILSSAEKCRRVARRMVFTTCSTGSLAGLDFRLIFAPSRATMSHKSSRAQSAESVSQALMTGTYEGR